MPCFIKISFMYGAVSVIPVVRRDFTLKKKFYAYQHLTETNDLPSIVIYLMQSDQGPKFEFVLLEEFYKLPCHHG